MLALQDKRSGDERDIKPLVSELEVKDNVYIEVKNWQHAYVIYIFTNASIKELVERIENICV